MNKMDMINWVRKRYKKTAKLQYLNDPMELEKLQALIYIFNKYDKDHSGTLDLQELDDMFKEHKITLS